MQWKRATSGTTKFDQLEKYVDFAAYRYPSVDSLLDFLRYRPDLYDRFFTYVTTPGRRQRFLRAR